MIIGGQNVVEAIREVMNNCSFATQEDIKAYCIYHNIGVVWSLDTEKKDVHVQSVELENS